MIVAEILEPHLVEAGRQATLAAVRAATFEHLFRGVESLDDEACLKEGYQDPAVADRRLQDGSGATGQPRKQELEIAERAPDRLVEVIDPGRQPLIAVLHPPCPSRPIRVPA